MKYFIFCVVLDMPLKRPGMWYQSKMHVNPTMMDLVKIAQHTS